MTETNQQVGAVVNHDELTAYVDSRIDANQPDPEELAEEVAQFIDTPTPESLSEGQVAQVVDIVNSRTPTSLTPDQRADVEAIVQNAIDDRVDELAGNLPDEPTLPDEPEDDDDYGEGSYGDDSYGGISDATESEFQETLKNLRVSSNPAHTRRIQTGVPDGEYHPFGDWGFVITVPETVHWRSAVIDAESAGLTRLQIYEFEFVEGETYNLGDLAATRDIHHEQGAQEIYPDVTLEAGQYFISRDPENVQPMRRVATDVDWETFNDEHDLPVRVEASWRANADYQPGNAVFEEKYRANNWDRRLYYFGNMEFGFQGETANGG